MRLAVTVRQMLAVTWLNLASLPGRLQNLLGNHDLPPGSADPPDRELPWKAKATLAPCVHADGYSMSANAT